MAKINKRKIFVILFWSAIVVPVLFITTIFTLISTGSMGFMPSFEELENPKSNLASEVYTEDGKLLGKYYRENRTVISFEDVSPLVVNALIATEDVRFFEHSGIDGKALTRVAYGVITGNRKGGGSTITQQLAKNLFPRDKTKYDSKIAKAWNMSITKFKEWVTAVKLERNYTKEEIMVMYLNTVTFGSETFGIKAAARTFFDTSPDSLKIEEAAVLVGLLKAPSAYSPVYKPKKSLSRRNTVINQMEKYNFITAAEADSLKEIPINLKYKVQSHNRGLGTYFREYMRITLHAKRPERKNYASWQDQMFYEDSLEWVNNPVYGWCNKNVKPNGLKYDLYKDGLRIYTTINSSMQTYAEQAVCEHLAGKLQPLFYQKSKNNKNGPYAWNMREDQLKSIQTSSIRRSERYRVLKKAGKDSTAIWEDFKTPAKMRIFKWIDKKLVNDSTAVYYTDVDTTMTPLDSILYYKYFLRAGFMSMDPNTGHVKAYVGGMNYRHFKYDHVKVAKRQVGSTFKPFVYTLAMMDGYSPCHEIPNIPYTITMKNGQPPYTPQFSSSNIKSAKISLKVGLANSLNQIAAWVMKQYNPEAVLKIAKAMGVRSHIDPVPAICVGSAEVTLFEMVGAYSTFANKGFYTEPIFVSRIEDKNGNTIATFKPKRSEAIDEQTAFMMIELMKGVVQMGTSVRLRYTYKLNNEIAGKTGTTNNNSDGWFIGITPNLVSGAWVGGEERSIHFASTTYGQGASMALPIWALYMQKVYKDESLGVKKERFKRPTQDMDVETDCSKYQQNQGGTNDENFLGSDNFLN